jgi:methyl-accepting chemotaxis protein
MMQRWRSATNERGQATFTLVLVVVVVAIAVVLLYRTAWTADSINKKAGTIAKTAGGINTSTQAVLKLGRTNQLASSILDTAKPLQGQLDQVINLAHSIDGLATSINGTAGTINGTAKGINSAAGTILGTARSINDGVAQINTNLDTTLALAAKIKADTGNILGQADTANHFASCIDRGLLTSTGNTAC